MLNHNQNVTSRRFELQAYVDVINTADAFKLSRLSKYIILCYLYIMNSGGHERLAQSFYTREIHVSAIKD